MGFLPPQSWVRIPPAARDRHATTEELTWWRTNRDGYRATVRSVRRCSLCGGGLSVEDVPGGLACLTVACENFHNAQATERGLMMPPHLREIAGLVYVLGRDDQVSRTERRALDADPEALYRAAGII